jgi:hypothetical protein
MYICTGLLPPGGYPIAVKYIISYQIKKHLKFPMKATVYPDYIYSMAAARQEM